MVCFLFFFVISLPTWILTIALQTWGGGSDSYFEYLIKYARLTNNNDPSFVQAWSTAVDSSIKTLRKVTEKKNSLRRVIAV